MHTPWGYHPYPTGVPSTHVWLYTTMHNHALSVLLRMRYGVRYYPVIQAQRVHEVALPLYVQGSDSPRTALYSPVAASTHALGPITPPT